MKTMKMLFTFALILSWGFFGCDTGNSNNNLTPAAGDYVISDNLSQIEGSTEAVTVTAQSGKSTGAVTVNYRGIQDTTYEKSTTPPAIAGNFLVTFDVAAAGGWNAAIDLVAGNLNINSGKSGAVLFEIPADDIADLIATVMKGMVPAPLNAMVTSSLLWDGVPSSLLPMLGSLPDETKALLALLPLTTLNSMVALVGNTMGVTTYEDLSLASDINFYHDAAAETEFRGVDEIDKNTIFYSTIPFSLIQSTLMGGGGRESFTVAALLDEIGFTDSITYPLTLDAFLNEISTGTTYASLTIQGLNLYSAATGGNMTGSTNITGADMTIWSNWPLDDVASMF